MRVENIEEKMMGTEGTGEKKQIIVTHVTIRQSLFFLVLKLLVVEAIAAVGVVLFHTVLLASEIMGSPQALGLFNIPLFVVFVILKFGLTLFIIDRWLEEYYEITPEEIIHRKGRFIRDEERWTVRHLASIKVEQGFLGRIFNYGTIKTHNWARNRDFYLYLIHNPMKYATILQNLAPEADKERHVFREHLIEKEEE